MAKPPRFRTVILYTIAQRKLLLTRKDPAIFPPQQVRAGVVKAPSSQSRNPAVSIAGRIRHQNQEWVNHSRNLPL